MPTDLYYFYESDLDKGSIETFYNSLPGHLRSQFDRCNRTKIFWGNVLQGYRGPSNMCNNGSGDSGTLQPSCGIQEIKYRWGARKDMNFIPLIGTCVFVGGKIKQKIESHQTEWVSLYFDSKTGDCLSHDKDEAAERLNSKGCRLFEEGKYSEAAEYYDNAYQSCSSGYRGEQTFADNAKKAKSELRAKSLNAEGDVLFGQGKYSEAFDKYKEAYDISQVSSQYRMYQVNREKAQAQINAKNLNTEGDNLYRQGKYSEAQSKYQEAYNLSQVDREKNIYAVNRDKAKIEVDATVLNTEGCNLFEQCKYSEADRKFQQAHDMTRIDSRKQTYEDNRIKAQTEKEALQLYSEGDNSFKLRRYNEAHGKFQDARKKSKVTAQIKKFQAMEDKAKIEIDAMQLNSQGDNLFNLGKYSDALHNYQQACNTSRVSIEQEIYSANIGKAQAIISKLNMLDTLWKQAWDAENDESCDEANALFARILTESKSSLEVFPGNSKLKQYETLVTLKIDGNEKFNQGIQLQINGVTLFEEALELKQRENYESANIKFKQAMVKFLDAQEKFEIGNKSDQRFSSCVEFVLEQIRTVKDSIKVTEQFILNQDLHNLNVIVNGDNHAGTHSYENHRVENRNNYVAQI